MTNPSPGGSDPYQPGGGADPYHPQPSGTEPTQPQPPYGAPTPEQGYAAPGSQSPGYEAYPPAGGYGAPGYGAPGYPPPAYQPTGTNVMAILSLVLAFVFAPAGIVLGHVAKKQIRQTGEQGDQLATWGLVLSYIFTGLSVLACCGAIVLGIAGASMESSTGY